MYYSIMMNIKNKSAVVIGGGNIAFRKTGSLLNSGANITVVSPDLNDCFLEIGDKIEYIKDQYNKKYIKDAFLVIGATSSKAVNKEIGIDCNSLNILYNDVDNCEESNFITPATVDKEGLLLSVSSKGRFPALCKYIKKDLDKRYERFDEEYVSLLEKIRSLVLDKYYEDRIKIFYDALELSLEDLKILYSKLLNDKYEKL